jgi:rRNA-processing protein CGR1
MRIQQLEMAKVNEVETVAVRGKAKSGRVWKTEKERFSNLTIQKPQRSSWDKKMKLKIEKKNLKEKEAQMKADVKQRKIVNDYL